MISTKIYLVENIEPGTNKVYIGKTKNNDRYYGHQSKYGLQIKYTIIDEIQSLNYNDWEPLESYWIEQFKQWGFNVINKRKKGGSGPISHTAETKQKISKGKTGHKCYSSIERSNKISKALQDHSKHYTEDIIQKMKKPKPEGFGNLLSEIKKGKPRPDLKGKKQPFKGRISPNKGKYIIQYDKQNNFIKEWNSATEASTILKINKSQISAVARGNTKYKTAGGFIWKYKKHE